MDVFPVADNKLKILVGHPFRINVGHNGPNSAYESMALASSLFAADGFECLLLATILNYSSTVISASSRHGIWFARPNRNFWIDFLNFFDFYIVLTLFIFIAGLILYVAGRIVRYKCILAVLIGRRWCHRNIIHRFIHSGFIRYRWLVYGFIWILQLEI